KHNCKVNEFILLGFSVDWQVDIVFFVVLLLVYMLTITGNVVIITATWVDRRLHSPMYFFLCNLSFLDAMVATAIAPKMMKDFLSKKKAISVSGCIAQCYFYFFLGTTEFILLAVMSLDRYVAICNPLRYSIIMNIRLTIQLMLLSWFGGFFSVLSPIIIISKLPFCGPNIIDHFFCDIEPLIRLSCADTALLEMIEFSLSTIVLLSSLMLTVVSYLYIITTILRIQSTTGRQKAFSTCASHITVVSITYSSCIFMYIKPNQDSEVDYSKGVALLNTVLAPLLVPFIYCLRNTQVQEALRGACRQKKTTQ
uniref:Olfactory receptor n=1 Tax=Podarcis muralis TaxID=64176 RepID=A0A670K6Z4_PODMU